jgi:hypothetical protein
MQTNTNMDWVINLSEKTCLNINTNIVVGFEKKGNTFAGEIRDLPDNIYDVWARNEDAASLIKNIVIEAKNVFSRAYTENLKAC